MTACLRKRKEEGAASHDEHWRDAVRGEHAYGDGDGKNSSEGASAIIGFEIGSSIFGCGNAMCRDAVIFAIRDQTLTGLVPAIPKPRVSIATAPFHSSSSSVPYSRTLPFSILLLLRKDLLRMQWRLYFCESLWSIAVCKMHQGI